MGLIRKVLFVMTGGLSGLVFKDNSKQQRKAPAAKRARTQKQPKATPAKPKPKRRAKPRAARASAKAPARNGTATELERLADLQKQGLLTSEEFAAAKAKLLGTSPTPAPPSNPPPIQPSPPSYRAVEANVTAARHLSGLAGGDRAASSASLNND
jgi:multidrug resistance efflux pump